MLLRNPTSLSSGVQGLDGGVYRTALGYQRFSSLRYTDTTHFEGGVERWE